MSGEAASCCCGSVSIDKLRRTPSTFPQDVGDGEDYRLHAEPNCKNKASFAPLDPAGLPVADVIGADMGRYVRAKLLLRVVLKSCVCHEERERNGQECRRERPCVETSRERPGVHAL
jgi:hypothetical protein